MSIVRIGRRVLNGADLNVKMISDIRKQPFKAVKRFSTPYVGMTSPFV
jgi:hypothetical protein